MKLAIFGCLIVAAIAAFLSLHGCGTASAAANVSIESVQAADGTWCYVAIQNAQAVGLSCK